MKKALKIAIASVLVASALVAGFLLRFPPDPLWLCQKAMDAGIEQYLLVTRTHAYPNVEGNSRTSFRLMVEYMVPRRHVERVISDYAYVPGLQNDDPSDLVMMYLKKKTRRHWNGDHSGSILRQPKWMVIGPGFWDAAGREEGCYEGGRLQTTEEFTQRLQRTLDFLKSNNRPNWTNAIKEHSEFLKTTKE